jgi:peptide/nickel transport system permease protein
MSRYILTRLLLAIPSLFLAAVAVFAIIRLIPGDPVQIMMGESGSAQQVAAVRESLGLDRSVPEQFLHWLGTILTGNLGASIVNKEDVLELVLDRAQVTAIVVFSAILLASLVAIPLGLFAAWRQNSRLDFAAVASATLLLSFPSFWLGLLLLTLFGLKLGWLPVVGYVPLSSDLSGGLLYLILPVVTLMAVEIGTLLRMSRSSAIEILRLEFVTHARAKGVPEWRVLFRHVLPNSFAPTWTVIGLVLGHLLGGIAVLETVFTLPGLGRLLVEAIFARDYPVVQGCLLFGASSYILINLLVDLVYPVFDPRVSLE